MKKIIAAAVVIALVLAGMPVMTGCSGAEIPSDTHSTMPEDWNRVIAYVPLDDRTDNIDNVIYMAEASGYRIVMPERDLFHTALDGQTLNSNGTQYGNREALFEWVKEMDEAGCDLFLLSIDQLLSGGLVNSRSMKESLPLRFDDGSVMSESEAFDKYIMTLGDDPNNRVYMFDSVVRLASTVGYNGFEEQEYTALRAYGKVERPELSGDELTLENIFAAYTYGADGITTADSFVTEEDGAALLTKEVIEDYLAARERKLSLTDHVINALKYTDNEQFKLLIGIDDSSALPNIQNNELAYISKVMGDNALLVAGLDSLARLMVAAMLKDEYDYSVKTYVEYIGGSENIPASDYDLYTAKQVVDLHMKIFEAVPSAEEDAELQMIVMTEPDDESRAQEYCDRLIEKLRSNQEKHIPTVLIEASSNKYGKLLEDAIMENVELAQLMGFSGRYYQANVVGAGFAMGFSRYLYLRCCENKDIYCDEAQLKQLVLSAEMSYAFAINSRFDMGAYVREMGLNSNNILCDKGDMGRIIKETERLMLLNSSSLLNNFKGGEIPCSLEPYDTRRVKSVSISDFRLPWNRTFEISFNINVAMK